MIISCVFENSDWRNEEYCYLCIITRYFNNNQNILYTNISKKKIIEFFCLILYWLASLHYTQNNFWTFRPAQNGNSLSYNIYLSVSYTNFPLYVHQILHQITGEHFSPASSLTDIRFPSALLLWQYIRINYTKFQNALSCR